MYKLEINLIYKNCFHFESITKQEPCYFSFSKRLNVHQKKEEKNSKQNKVFWYFVSVKLINWDEMLWLHFFLNKIVLYSYYLNN